MDGFQASLDFALARARDLVQPGALQIVPTDLEKIASELGVVRIEPSAMMADGYLSHLSGNRLVIRYREDNPRCRNRFTIAHEIGHILYAEAKGDPILDRVHRGYDRNVAEEIAANRIASELLMPEGAVIRRIQDRQPRWDIIVSLAKQFDVSLTAMALRVLELRGFLAMFVRITRVNASEHRVFNSKWKFSVGVGLKTIRPGSAEGNRIAREAVTRRMHDIRIRTAYSGVEELQCAGIVRSNTFERRVRREYWAIGWKLEEPPLFVHHARIRANDQVNENDQIGSRRKI